MSPLINELQQISTSQLGELIGQVLEKADEEVFSAQSVDITAVNSQFADQINNLFAILQGKTVTDETSDEVINFDNLTLVLDEELDVLVAIEGMVASARNKFLPSFISFNTRLNSLIDDQLVNEANNPLDPGNIFEAFRNSTKSLGMDAGQSLAVCRLFNRMVLWELGSVFAAANQLLIDHDILPDIGEEPKLSPVKAHSRAAPRSSVKPEETTNFGMTPTDAVAAEPYQETKENPELFSLMQNLMHAPEESASMPAAGTPTGAQVSVDAVPGSSGRNYVIPAEMLSPELLRTDANATISPDQHVEVVDQKQLIGLLSNIQDTLARLPQAQPNEHPGSPEEIESPDIEQSIAEMLQAGEADGVVNAVDRQSHDVIHLVTMLYEAIWSDDALPIPIKELIGRTQITIIQVALSDNNFFNQEDHPARALLNEFAASGIGWSEVDNLAEDSLYKEISGLVQKILQDYEGDIQFFEKLLQEFKSYRAKEAARDRRLEQRVKHTQEGKSREEFAKKLVTQRIEERLLGRALHPFVRQLLSGSFHKFLVLLVLKEGPGSKAWTQAINTVDVLLWSVQPHEQPNDRERLETINPRLINNLRRALHIASVDKESIDSTLETLQQIQQASFDDMQQDLELDEMLDSEDIVFEGMEKEGEPDPDSTATVQDEPEILEEGDEYLRQADNLGVGTWVEFAIEDDQFVRCKLAARINAIDKYIFVNRQGVKVLEKNRQGLALEFKQASVRVISDGLMFSRALESVISNLRETQSAQRDSGAYQAQPA